MGYHGIQASLLTFSTKPCLNSKFKLISNVLSLRHLDLDALFPVPSVFHHVVISLSCLQFVFLQPAKSFMFLS